MLDMIKSRHISLNKGGKNLFWSFLKQKKVLSGFKYVHIEPGTRFSFRLMKITELIIVRYGWCTQYTWKLGSIE